MICNPLRRVFPDLVSIKKAGLLLDHEMIFLKQEEVLAKNYPRGLIVIECKSDVINRYERAPLLDRPYGFFEKIVL